MTVPTFLADDKPAAIVDGVGRWLSEELGFRWIKSRQSLERRRETQIQELHLQPSVWNRAGVATWVWPRVSVFDTRLAEWRAANKDATVSGAGTGRYASLVYTTMLTNVEQALADVELSGLPQPNSSTSLATFRAAIRTDIIPVVELFAVPALLPALLPQSWVRMVDAATVEWMIATAGRDEASALLRRRMEPDTGKQAAAGDQRARLRAFERGWAAAPDAQGRESVRDNYSAQLGWLSRVHGLLDPQSLAP